MPPPPVGASGLLVPVLVVADHYADVTAFAPAPAAELCRVSSVALLRDDFPELVRKAGGRKLLLRNLPSAEQPDGHCPT